MEKELEALEVKPIKDTTLDCMNDLISDLEQYEQWFDNEEYCKEELQWLKGWSERVKEDLLELKEIKEAKPSEALKWIDKHIDWNCEKIEELKNRDKGIADIYDDENKMLVTIKQVLLKAQELEKVLNDIIKHLSFEGSGVEVVKDFINDKEETKYIIKIESKDTGATIHIHLDTKEEFDTLKRCLNEK